MVVVMLLVVVVGVTNQYPNAIIFYRSGLILIIALKVMSIV